MNKCYKSIDEQIKYLETNKKIIVSQAKKERKNIWVS